MFGTNCKAANAAAARKEAIATWSPTKKVTGVCIVAAVAGWITLCKGTVMAPEAVQKSRHLNRQGTRNRQRSRQGNGNRNRNRDRNPPQGAGQIINLNVTLNVAHRTTAGKPEVWVYQNKWGCPSRQDARAMVSGYQAANIKMGTDLSEQKKKMFRWQISLDDLVGTHVGTHIWLVFYDGTRDGGISNRASNPFIGLECIEFKEMKGQSDEYEFEQKIIKNYQNHQPGKNIILSPLSIRAVLNAFSLGLEATANVTKTREKPLTITGKKRFYWNRKWHYTKEYEHKVQYTITKDVRQEMRREFGIPAKDSDLETFFEDRELYLNHNYLYYRLGKVKNDYLRNLEALGFETTWAARLTLKVNEINRKVSLATHKQIQNFLDSGSIAEDTDVILLNAVGFKGKWVEKFAEKCSDFDGSQSEMLRTIATVDYKEHSDRLFVTMPFQWRQRRQGSQWPKMYMTFAMRTDNDGGFPSIIEMKSFWDADRDRGRADIKLPRFEFKTNFNLQDEAAKVDADAAGNMFAYGEKNAFTTGTVVSKFVHQAAIKLTPAGVSASGASAILAESRSMVKDFNFNKPLSFAIHDEYFDVAFTGRVSEVPTEGHAC